MRLIKVDSLKPGDVLSTPIRNADGSLLLQANKLITEAYISRLKGLKVSALYVVDELFDDVLATPVLNDEQKSEVLQLISETFARVKKKQTLDYDNLSGASGLIYDNVSTQQIPISLVNMFAIDEPRTFHALNVAMMVAAMSVEAGWNRTVAVDYITGAMLHDLMITDMNKAEPPAHTDEVYHCLKDMVVVPPRTYMSCYMHHDAFDGSSGNRRASGKTLNEGARMIAAADIYDNATHGYCGSPLMKPHQALEFLNTKSGTLLDPDIVKIFNTTVSIYPTGATVLLNNGYRAIVTHQNHKTPARPVVRLLMKSREDCLEFNLLTSRTLFIEKVEL